MPRRNGSLFGVTVNPTPAAASGIWRVREAEEYLRVNKWPATPGVPSSPVGVAGNAHVSLTWTAPTLGSPPTDYQVQYSSDSGATWTTFSDGTSTATSAVVTGLTNDTGYIFRVRAVNALGEGPYGAASGTVTPGAPNSALLLLHFDGANGSTTFTDSSGNSSTVTAYGNAQISTAQSRFGGASAAMLSAGDYIGVADVPAMGTDDFTVELWVRYSGQRAGGTEHIVGHHTAFVGADWLVCGNEGYFGFYDGSVRSSTIPLADYVGQWVHLALVRNGGAMTLYVDGAEAVSSIGGWDFGSSHPFTIAGADGGTYVSGYYDELRIVKGTAVYTANFTPPTAPFGGQPPAATPALLLHFDGANGSTTFTDSSPNALTATVYGNAQISTAQSRFGGASGYFDGTPGTYAFIPASAATSLNDGDFCIEFWGQRVGGSNNYATAVGHGDAGTADDSFLFCEWTSGYLAFGSFATGVITVSPPSDGEWHHIAFTRSGGTIRLFVDGVLQDSQSVSGTGVIAGKDWYVGAGSYSVTDRRWNGYIDELRIVKGTAVYTSNFTPPTAPF